MARLRVKQRSLEGQPVQHRPSCFTFSCTGCAGHVGRMENIRMPEAVFFSQLQNGKSGGVALRERYKDRIKRQLARARINYQSWQQASDWDSRRSSIREKGQSSVPDKTAQSRKNARGRKSPRPPSHCQQTFTCPKCSGVCTATIRLTATNVHGGADPPLFQILVCKKLCW